MKRGLLLILLMLSPVTMPAATRAITAETHSDFSSIKVALDAFAVDCGRYPSTTEGLAALVQCPTTIESGRWHGPYLAGIPKDVWGNDYRYVFPGRHHINGIDLYSCGFDGVSKTGGEDLDDINNWDYSSPHGGNDGYANYREFIVDKFGPVILLAIMVITLLAGWRLCGLVFFHRPWLILPATGPGICFGFWHWVLPCGIIFSCTIPLWAVSSTCSCIGAPDSSRLSRNHAVETQRLLGLFA